MVEDPLLIDPTTRNPGKHLSWKIAKGLSVVVPIYRNGKADPYGNATIHSFGLNRQGLVEERTRMLLEVQVEQIRLLDDIDHAMTLNEEQLADFLPKLNQRLEDFRRHGADTAPYASCVLSYIEQVETSLRKRLNALLVGLSQKEQEAQM